MKKLTTDRTSLGKTILQQPKLFEKIKEYQTIQIMHNV